MDISSATRRRVLATVGGGVVPLAGCMDTAETGSVDENTEHTESNGTTITETEYESLVLFRNDDPAPWTDLEPLRAVNDLFIQHDVPVTQSIVPHDTNENENLDSEHEVCHYLTELDTEHGELFENALHGFHHAHETDFHGGSEFGGLSYEEQRQKITDGYEILHECVDTAKIFVPPFNTYSTETVEILVEEDFKLVSGSLHFQDEYFGERGFWEDENIIHLPVNLSMEDWDTEEVRDVTTLKEEYDQNKEAFGMNSIMLHYYFYPDEENQQKLDEIIQYATEDDCRFLTLGEFANKVEHDAISRTETGWSIEE